MDGDFSEWRDHAPSATDPAGDATGAMDITELRLDSKGSTLYIHFDVGRELNIQSGAPEEGTLKLHITLPAGHELVMDLRGREARLNGAWISWERIDYIALPTHSATAFELRADLADLGVQRGDTVAIQFSGSDSLAAPVSYNLATPSAPTPEFSPGRMARTDVRIGSYNTEHEGLSNPGRRDAIARQLRAVDADIWCFQEEAGTDDLAAILAEMLPGKPWHVVKSGDCVVASRWPVVDLGFDHWRWTVAGVELPGDRRLLVASIHPKCCGFIGDSADRKRIVQTIELIDALSTVREGEQAVAAPFANAPVIVIGDYNLVGSRMPLTLLEKAPGLTLQHWPLPQPDGNSVATWRGGHKSSFAPGLLDLVTHSPQGLTRRRGYVLNTARMDAATLRELRLEATDSNASDHLLMVTDFQVADQ